MPEDNTLRNIQPRRPVPEPKLKIYYHHYMPVTFWYYPGRNAPFWYLYWNETPGARIFSNGRKFELDRSSVVLIPPYTTFDQQADGTFIQLFIHFTAGEPFTHLKREVLQLPLEAWEIPSEPERLAERNELGQWRIYAFLYQMLLKVPQENFLRGAHSISPRIMEAIDLITHDPSQTFSNAVLCRKLGMSEASFLRLFRREIGQSPAHYQLCRRLDAAHGMLGTPELTIDEIARSTGFADRYCFSKAFRAFYQEPPGRYRKRLLSAQKEKEERI